LTPAFHFQILNNFIPIFNTQAKILVNILDGKSNGDAFDIVPFASKVAIDIICGMCVKKFTANIYKMENSCFQKHQWESN